MNHDPQILLEATLKQISDDYGHARALNLFALSSRGAAGDSNAKNAALPSSVFKHCRFCPSFAVRAVPSPPCSSSESPRHPELPPAPRNCFTKCKMWSFLTRWPWEKWIHCLRLFPRHQETRSSALGLPGYLQVTVKPLHYCPSA